MKVLLEFGAGNIPLCHQIVFLNGHHLIKTFLSRVTFRLACMDKDDDGLAVEYTHITALAAMGQIGHISAHYDSSFELGTQNVHYFTLLYEYYRVCIFPFYSHARSCAS